MDKVLKLAEELKKELDALPLFIEYKRVKNNLENNPEIQELKKEIVRAKNENRLQDHKELLARYNNHPLYLNFVRLDDEVSEYLKEIVNILNKKW